MEEQWGEKMNLYFDNLSPFYMFSVAFSVFAIIFSWWYSKHCHREIKNTMKRSEASMENEKDVSQDSDEGLDTLNRDFTDNKNQDVASETLQSKIKAARHQAIVNKLSANMTAEQIIEEKETEKAQLAAILNLLKEQQEKFQVSDMHELEEQLSLYR